MTDYNSDNDDDHTLDCEDEEDEATLDEEEGLNDEEDYGNELKELQEDGELSIEELRRKYYGNEEIGETAKTSKEIEENLKDAKNAQSSSFSCPQQQRVGSLRGKIISSIASTCEAAVNNYFKPEDLEEDESEDYLPPELWKKEIRIGPDYQVSNIPQVIQISNNKNKPVETCEVLWISSPDCCPESVVTEYLIECEQIRAGEKPKNGMSQTSKKRSSSETVSTLMGEEGIVPDDENALFALYLANYNVKKAKAKAPFEWPALCSVNGPRLTQPQGTLRTWTEEDCENFEKGMAEHGKHFLKIQRDYLQRRTLGEIVSFYYSWKKSERHNIWRQVQQSRRELQHVDVKCVDLMGQIAESILRQNQVEVVKEERNGGNIVVENSITDTLKTTTSTSTE
uniref:Uncharacterized protein n=1 Tax=Meloidogyne enterolobii TaxID=390850 RepID=A0A6V7U6T1_MELEN|nr:unnamed protein product [Meloidogyne enterolobii]